MPVLEKRYGFGEPERLMVGLGWKTKTAWDYIQERDKKYLGAYIADKEEQAKMCRAVFLAGGLPYMWDMAEDFRKAVYDALSLEKGDKVLIIGEALEACGFLEEVKTRLQGEGEIQAYEICDVARGANVEEAKRVGWHAGVWRYPYADNFPNEYFDAIFFPQGVHHEVDWTERANDFARILKTGKRMVFAEVTLGLSPDFRIAVQADVHIEAIMKKIFVLGMRMDPATWWENPNQPTPKDIEGWFRPYLKDIHSSVRNGMMLVYGTKK